MDNKDRDRRIVIIGSDHAGFEAKSHVIEYLKSMGYFVLDKGTYSPDSVDYPDYAVAVAEALHDHENATGIVLCGSGIGVSIVANKVKGVRAALCTTPKHAEMARKHNNANILAMGGRMTSPEDMDAIMDVWFSTDFEGGRHQRRVEKIHSLTEK